MTSSIPSAKNTRTFDLPFPHVFSSSKARNSKNSVITSSRTSAMTNMFERTVEAACNKALANHSAFRSKQSFSAQQSFSSQPPAFPQQSHSSELSPSISTSMQKSFSPNQSSSVHKSPFLHQSPSRSLHETTKPASPQQLPSIQRSPSPTSITPAPFQKPPALFPPTIPYHSKPSYSPSKPSYYDNFDRTIFLTDPNPTRTLEISPVPRPTYAGIAKSPASNRNATAPRTPAIPLQSKPPASSQKH